MRPALAASPLLLAAALGCSPTLGDPEPVRVAGTWTGSITRETVHESESCATAALRAGLPMVVAIELRLTQSGQTVTGTLQAPGLGSSCVVEGGSYPAVFLSSGASVGLHARDCTPACRAFPCEAGQTIDLCLDEVSLYTLNPQADELSGTLHVLEREERPPGHVSLTSTGTFTIRRR